ncbi:MAG TPA: glycosyltransferase family 4 protein [Alphaproteobacteria bacterium]|nr:glycosyltransferase family 4 protein [Alphaproteobacteria bacterium]
MTASAGKRRVLIIVQNLPVPFDRRVWQEATTLQQNGYDVSVICPVGRGYTKRFEVSDGIHIYRHPLPLEAKGAAGYAIEYSLSLFWEFWLACKVLWQRGFDAIHACNPPDTIFLIGGFFKLFGKKFVFDHHDINPELYEAKFGRRDIFYKIMLLCERLTFLTADIVISTNNSYRQIAQQRGNKKASETFVVRSGPDLKRIKTLPPVLALKHGKQFLVGYLGVMGQQEGIQYLIEAARYIVFDLKRTDIHFTLIGAGPSLSHYKNLVKVAGLDEFINFTGHADDETMLHILNTADVCVNPDEVNAMNDKSTMNKIMEYMALGKPIVQFDVTEGRVSAGEASLYAQANNPQDMAGKILHLLNNPELRARMGAFGRERVERELAWPHEAPKLLAAYDNLFATPLKRPHDSAVQEDHLVSSPPGSHVRAGGLSSPR